MKLPVARLPCFTGKSPMFRISVVFLIAFAGIGFPRDVARASDPAIPNDEVVSVVDERLAEWWLQPDERLFDEIGWAKDVRSALRLAAESDRPVFLFTMDGRVNTGRC